MPRADEFLAKNSSSGVARFAKREHVHVVSVFVIKSLFDLVGNSHRRSDF